MAGWQSDALDQLGPAVMQAIQASPEMETEMFKMCFGALLWADWTGAEAYMCDHVHRR